MLDAACAVFLWVQLSSSTDPCVSHNNTDFDDILPHDLSTMLQRIREAHATPLPDPAIAHQHQHQPQQQQHQQHAQQQQGFPAWLQHLPGPAQPQQQQQQGAAGVEGAAGAADNDAGGGLPLPLPPLPLPANLQPGLQDLLDALGQ